MARQITEGFEAGDLMFWSGTPSNIAIVTSDVRIGGRACRIGASGANARKDFPTPVDEIFFRVAVCYIGNTNNSIQILDTNSASVLSLVRSPSTLKYGVTVAGVGIGTIDLAMPIDTYFVVEGHVKLHGTDGIVQLKIDGTMQLDWTGDTQPGAATNLGMFYVTGQNLSTPTSFVIDDLAINDTTGAEDNSWCGDAHIYALTPNANGDSSQFTGSDGNSTDNYLLVDEIPSNNDTDYVFSSTSGHKDLYNLSALPTLPSGSTIKRVIIETRARELTADGDSINVGVKSGSTEGWSANLPLGISYAPKLAEFITNPATGVAWTESEINAMQAGVKVP